MAAIDQPTAPNLGNQTLAQFLNLPDWAVIATNQLADDGSELPDTFTAMEFCVVALFYRLVRDNFAYENEAWACRVQTPLLTKIQELEQQLQTRATDNRGQALTLTLLQTFALPTPTLLYSGDGTVLDPVTNQVTLINVDPPDDPHPVYHVVNARGGASTPGAITYGLRATSNRYYYTASHVPQFESTDIVASCNVVPQWPEDSGADSKIVLLAVKRYDVASDTGATDRMQFEFGLSRALTAFDPNAHGTDRVLYLRYYDAGDVEQIIPALVNGEAVGISPGREVTLAFSFIDTGGTGDLRFYVNGVPIYTASGVNLLSPGTSSDIRLHVGSDRFGDHHCGGPINNVYFDGAPTGGQSGADSTIHGVYRVGAGYLTT